MFFLSYPIGVVRFVYDYILIIAIAISDSVDLYTTVYI